MPRWLHRTLRIRVRVPARGVGVVLLTLAVSSKVGDMLWWGVETLKGIGVLNCEWPL